MKASTAGVLAVVVLGVVASLASASVSLPPTASLHKRLRKVGLGKGTHLQKALHEFHPVSWQNVTRDRITRRSNGLDLHNHRLTFHALGRTFDLELGQNLYMFRFPIQVTVHGDNGVTEMEVDKHNYLHGHVIGESDSSVSVYLNEEGFFHGTIRIRKDLFIVESAHRHYADGEPVDFIIYNEKSIHPDNFKAMSNGTSHSFCGSDHQSPQFHVDEADSMNIFSIFEANDEKASQRKRREDDLYGPEKDTKGRFRRSPASSTFNSCLLTVVADFSFVLSNSNNTAVATAVMLSHIARAHQIFRDTVFSDTTSSYTGLGLAVSRVKLYTSTAADPYFKSTLWDVGDLLRKFSETENWSGACLAHLFTNVDFDGGTLGLAWVGNPDLTKAGGICHSSSSQWLNTGLTTTMNFGAPVVSGVTQLVTTHEIGHNWGSSHDETTECVGDDTNGRFLMYPIAVDGSKQNNLKFSTCSKSSIASVIRTKGLCFERAPQGICGNGAVERNGTDGNAATTSDNEDCDAGGEDACCSLSCKFKPGARCSDKNNECCLNCQANLGALCFVAFDNDPQCRNNSVCRNTTGTLGCEDPIPVKRAGLPCGTGGRCDGLTTHGTNYAARCTPFCERFGARSCACTGDKECLVCCKNDASVPLPSNCASRVFASFGDQCVSAKDAFIAAGDPAADSDCLADNSTNVAGTAYRDNPKLDISCVDGDEKCLRVLFSTPGTVCSEGLCNREGVCEESSTQVARFWNQFQNLSIDDVRRWIKENIVGAVMLFAFLLWCPCGCLINRYDKKQQETNANYGRKRHSMGTMKWSRPGTAAAPVNKKAPKQYPQPGGRSSRSSGAAPAASGGRPQQGPVSGAASAEAHRQSKLQGAHQQARGGAPPQSSRGGGAPPQSSRGGGAPPQSSRGGGQQPPNFHQTRMQGQQVR